MNIKTLDRNREAAETPRRKGNIQENQPQNRTDDTDQLVILIGLIFGNPWLNVLGFLCVLCALAAWRLEFPARRNQGLRMNSSMPQRRQERVCVEGFQ